jgi:phosphorylase kinase alpha/beta subunit
LEILEDSLAQQIVEEIIANLRGELGIRRYMGDNFWCRDFQNLPKNIQNSPYTDRQDWLREHAKEIVLGEEAQWCIFDPIISAYYGRKYQSKSSKPEDLRLQIQYLNRSLNQITQKGYIVEERSPEGIDKSVEIPEFKCPELYYIQKGRHTPNTSTPLLWAQANLLIALEAMKQSLLQSPTSN